MPKQAMGICERLYSKTMHPNLLNGSGNVFQVDANLGAMAATVEFLLQSHAGEIELLPALPSVWKTGRVKGLRARGGFSVDLEWKDGELQAAHITNLLGAHCVVRYRDKTLKIDLRSGETRRLNKELV